MWRKSDNSLVFSQQKCAKCYNNNIFSFSVGHHHHIYILHIILPLKKILEWCISGNCDIATQDCIWSTNLHTKYITYVSLIHRRCITDTSLIHHWFITDTSLIHSCHNFSLCYACIRGILYSSIFLPACHLATDITTTPRSITRMHSTESVTTSTAQLK